MFHRFGAPTGEPAGGTGGYVGLKPLLAAGIRCSMDAGSIHVVISTMVGKQSP